ncbi:uncharacterized protein LOC131619978 [Vicia villosa]|uniref:uncharacterized protein LOC131619978 n=1 Tax=Vicia villosa TaxID=3911 RepID=UPI00273CE569|nr:uncharacterized protein LOC131619978 [Vicia villosa]
MCFHKKWRKWIAECLKSARVSILVNDSPTNEFRMERGLRQGDPLSPFLFLIAAEGFSMLMKKAVECGEFIWYKIEKGTDRFTHLQYVDDTLIIGDKRWSNIRIIKANLLMFEVMSRLKVNFNKSKIVGINIHDRWLEEASKILNCQKGFIPFIYLGLPIGDNPNKINTWWPVIETVRSRLLRWKNRYISFDGRVVLIKSVFHALSVYFLSFFEAPTGKWKWKIKSERHRLWLKALKNRYGEEEVMRGMASSKDSNWWKKLCKVSGNKFASGYAFPLLCTEKVWSILFNLKE